MNNNQPSADPLIHARKASWHSQYGSTLCCQLASAATKFSDRPEAVTCPQCRRSLSRRGKIVG